MLSNVGIHGKSLALVDVRNGIFHVFSHPQMKCSRSGQGGGIPFGKNDEIWSYLFSTSTQPFQDDGARENQKYF